MRLRHAVVLAAAAACVFVYLTGTAEIARSQAISKARGVCMVSLTFFIDRECGASWYMTLSAVLLDLPLHNAATLTAFTIACGSLALAIAAIFEPYESEYGMQSLVDYAGALILLPTIFYGLSWVLNAGVIVNAWFPSWLLALLWVLWVLSMGASNAELLYGYLKLRTVRAEARQVVQQLRQLNMKLFEQAAKAVKVSQAPAAAAAASGADSKLQCDSDVKLFVGHLADSRAALQEKLQSLHACAEHAEGMALLYPAFHTQQSMKCQRQPAQIFI